MKDRDTIIRETAISRKNLIELIIVVIVLSFGVNVIAGQFLTWLQGKPSIALLAGIIFCLAPIAYTMITISGRRVKKRTIEAFFAYNPIKLEFVPVSRYEFSEGISRYIKAAFAENSALKTRWENQPLEPYRFEVVASDGSIKKVNREALSQMRIPIDGSAETLMPDDGTLSLNFYQVSPKNNDTAKLLLEAMEYFLLEKLSGELHRHFNNEEFNEKYLTVYERSDVPPVLLGNTFLELFSRPMIERPAFVEKALAQTDTDTTTDTEVYQSVALDSGGSTYTKFRLILPKGSRVKRPSDHEIEIETRKIKIRLAVRFQGQVAAVSHDFIHYYMGITNLFDLATYSSYIDIHVSVKWRAMLSNIGWSYYQWVDTFLDEVEKSASEQAFFKHIHWESTLTLLMCLKRTQNSMRAKQENEEHAVRMTLEAQNNTEKRQN